MLLIMALFWGTTSAWAADKPTKRAHKPNVTNTAYKRTVTPKHKSSECALRNNNKRLLSSNSHWPSSGSRSSTKPMSTGKKNVDGT